MVLIDTSSWIEALRMDGDAAVRAEVAALISSGEARLCDLVRLELWNGARGEPEQGKLRDIEKAIATLPVDGAVWDKAMGLARSARRAGLTVPATDILIVACSRRHGAGLLHGDGHMAALLAL